MNKGQLILRRGNKRLVKIGMPDDPKPVYIIEVCQTDLLGNESWSTSTTMISAFSIALAEEVGKYHSQEFHQGLFPSLEKLLRGCEVITWYEHTSHAESHSTGFAKT